MAKFILFFYDHNSSFKAFCNNEKNEIMSAHSAMMVA